MGSMLSVMECGMDRMEECTRMLSVEQRTSPWEVI
jgi:hypothetical protein